MLFQAAKYVDTLKQWDECDRPRISMTLVLGEIPDIQGAEEVPIYPERRVIPAARRYDVLQPADQQIFLIDEDEVVRDSLKVLLECHGVQVQDFRNSADFLASSNAPGGGCLVLGFNRLIVDGLELITILQRRGITLPVIFIVGGGDASTRAAALGAGAFAYLERPIEEAALIRTVRAALLRRSGGRSTNGDSKSANLQASLVPAQP
jgi:FixJ family two-component response regulator